MSVRLYDVLKNEPTKNVPFHCDGCSRVLPKLTEIGNVLTSQNERIDSCEKKVDEFKETIESVVQEKVENAIQEFKEREDRKCNIILHNIPEPVQIVSLSMRMTNKVSKMYSISLSVMIQKSLILQD